MKKQYINIAEKASELERQRNWLAASKHWQNAVSIAPAGSRN
ncbi:ANR family transcriptional regulator [Vibrio campbellii]|nr:ANR family transcriptional regulator [Vibrio campbellii]